MTKSVFSEGLTRYFSEAQLQILSQASIGIAGAGGLGSNCAMMLARCGVGRLVLVDHDVVDGSNLNRQHFFPKHVGMPKVDALAEQLRDLSDTIQVVAIAERLCIENIQTIFAQCSIVVEAVDLASTKALLIQELLSCGKTVVAASGMAGWGGQGMRKKELGSRLIVVGDFKNEVGTAQEVGQVQQKGKACAVEVGQQAPSEPLLPPLAPRVMMAASMQADAVLGLILGPCPMMR